MSVTDPMGPDEARALEESDDEAREDAAVDPPRTFARYCELRAMAFDALTIAEEANPHLTDEERARAVAHNRDFAAQYRRMPAEIEAELGTPGGAELPF